MQGHSADNGWHLSSEVKRGLVSLRQSWVLMSDYGLPLDTQIRLCTAVVVLLLLYVAKKPGHLSLPMTKMD